MRENTPALLGRISLWIFYALLAYMPLHIFLSTWLGTSFGVLEVAKVGKDVVLAGGFLLVLVAALWGPGVRSLTRDKLLWLMLIYGVLTIGYAVVKPTDFDAEALGVVYNLRFLIFFAYAALLTRFFDARHMVRRAVQVALASGALVVTFGLAQYLFLPNDALSHVGYSRSNGVLPVFLIDEKPDLERVMSTLRDPNSLGSYLIIVAPLAAAAFLLQKQPRKKALLGALLVATVFCAALTFSRSAWIGMAVALLTFVLLADHPFKAAVKKQQKRITTVSVAVVVVLLGGLFTMRNSYFVQNVILHADQSTVLEDPNELRVRFFKESVANIRENPGGSGPGTAGLASIRNNVQGTVLNENYYLQLATEVGVAGLALFLGILGLTGLRLWRRHYGDQIAQALLAAFVGLAITNVLVHIWANEAVAYTWWGLAGLVIYSKQPRQKGLAKRRKI